MVLSSQIFIIFKLDFDHVTAVSSLMDRLLDLSKNSIQYEIQCVRSSMDQNTSQMTFSMLYSVLWRYMRLMDLKLKECTSKLYSTKFNVSVNDSKIKSYCLFPQSFPSVKLLCTYNRTYTISELFSHFWLQCMITLTIML
jgi:hypothetical protein